MPHEFARVLIRVMERPLTYESTPAPPEEPRPCRLSSPRIASCRLTCGSLGCACPSDGSVRLSNTRVLATSVTDYEKWIPYRVHWN